MPTVARVRCLVIWLLAVAWSAASAGAADGRIYEVKYPASTKEGELVFAVNYRLWIPDGVKKVRAVIVHQHGCGAGACKGGETAADDLHWQALAKKWDAALLGPRYFQEDGQNCRLWCDPRNGSAKTFLRCLTDLAEQSKHPEVATAPWCLWGHSGGGFWASLMQVQYPERIVAIWFRSGTAFAAWEKGEIPKPEIPAAAYQIPAMLNPGAKENGDPRFAGAWTGSMAMFKAYRPHGALLGFAADPKSAHECGDSRYLAIPFFDACLTQRLPKLFDESGLLQPMDPKKAWLAPLLGEKAVAAAEYAGDVKDSAWLPDERIAAAWAEYIKTGFPADKTHPASPVAVKAVVRDGATELTWKAEADFESGISGFVIRRDGKELARIPEKPVARFSRALFQGMSYHDTPDQPLAVMKYIDRTPGADKSSYEVITLNAAGLASEPAKAGP